MSGQGLVLSHAHLLNRRGNFEGNLITFVESAARNNSSRWSMIGKNS